MQIYILFRIKPINSINFIGIKIKVLFFTFVLAPSGEQNFLNL